MATLEELVVELRAETSQLRAELKKASKSVDDSTKDIRKDLEGLRKDTNKNLSLAKVAFANFAGFIARDVVNGAFRLLASASREAFRTFVTEGVEAANVQQDALNDVARAFAQVGEFSQAAIKDAQDFASALQRQSTTGDEAVLANLALAQSYVKTADEAKELTAAALDFAEGAQISVTEAVRRLGRGVQGSAGDIANFAPEIRNLTKDQLAAGEATRILADRFRGAAAAAAQTFGGQIKGLQNDFGDLQEEFGFAIQGSDALVAVFQELRNIVLQSSGGIKQNRGELISFINDGVIVAIETLQLLVQTTGAFKDTANITFAGVNVAVTGLVGTIKVLGQTMKELIDGDFSFEEIGKVAEQAANDSADAVKGLTDAVEQSGQTDALDRISGALELIKQRAQEAAENQKDPAIVAELENRRKKAEELAAAFKKIRQETVGWAQDLADTGSSAETTFQRQQDALRRSLEDGTIDVETFSQQQSEILEEKRQADIERLNTIRADDLSNIEDFEAAKIEIETRNGLAQQELESEVQKKREEQEKRRVGNLRGTLGTIATLQDSSSKELAAIGKAAALSQATIDGIAAVQKALASAPPPINFALAGLVGAATAANVAKIAALQGGIDNVPGSGTADNFPALLAPGERVVPRQTNMDLKEFLERANAGNGAGETIINVTQNFGVVAGDPAEFGRVSAEAINDAVAAGTARLIS